MGELGFASAAWLFVREVAAKGGEALVQQLRDTQGRAFPVLDAVAASWQQGQREPVINLAPVVAACSGLRRLLIVGLEADFLDALLPQLAGIEVGLLRYSLVEVDWGRVQANYHGQATLTDLVGFQDFAGKDGAILTFLYSHSAHIAQPCWASTLRSGSRRAARAMAASPPRAAPMPASRSDRRMAAAGHAAAAGHKVP